VILWGVPVLAAAVTTVILVGFQAPDRWVIVDMTERMGLEGVGLDPQVGQVLEPGLLGATERSAVEVQLGGRSGSRSRPAPAWNCRPRRAAGSAGPARRHGEGETPRDHRRAQRGAGPGDRDRRGAGVDAGATFAVTRNDDGTCVSLHEGVSG